MKKCFKAMHLGPNNKNFTYQGEVHSLEIFEEKKELGIWTIVR